MEQEQSLGTLSEAFNVLEERRKFLGNVIIEVYILCGYFLGKRRLLEARERIGNGEQKGGGG